MGSPDSDVRSMCPGYFGADGRPRTESGRFMLRTALGAAAAVLPAVAAVTPAAAASSNPPAIGPAIGGAQLAGHGVLVNYPSGSIPRLPKVTASAWVIADAGTGQVLAAKDPHR